MSTYLLNIAAPSGISGGRGAQAAGEPSAQKTHSHGPPASLHVPPQIEHAPEPHGPMMQTPPWHVSGRVQTLPSSHAEPSGLTRQMALQHEAPVPLAAASSHSSPKAADTAPSPQNDPSSVHSSGTPPGQRDSYAPMSQPVPCGLVTPR
jgi:hypothetical protein